MRFLGFALSLSCFNVRGHCFGAKLAGFIHPKPYLGAGAAKKEREREEGFRQWLVGVGSGLVRASSMLRRFSSLTERDSPFLPLLLLFLPGRWLGLLHILLIRLMHGVCWCCCGCGLDRRLSLNGIAPEDARSVVSF